MKNPPGFKGGDTLSSIARRAARLPGCDRLCVHLSDRLAGLYPIVSGLEGDKCLSIWIDYCETACGFLQMLRVQTQRTQLLFRLATSRKVVCIVYHAHERLDSIYTSIDEKENEALAGAWRDSWNEDQDRQVSFFTEAIGSTTPMDMLHQFRSPMKLDETLAELSKQIKVHQDEVSDDSGASSALLRLMVKVYSDVGPVYPASTTLPKLFKWFVLADAVELEKPPVGEGMFSIIYRGKWSDPGRKGIVAVKMLSKTDNSEVFSSEISVWCDLSHRNILKLFGANHIVKNKFFVCQFANAGNFVEFFSNSDEDEGSDTNRKFLWGLFTQAARGLAYLHENHVEYGGLKCNNLLLYRDEMDKLVVKLSDFGFSRVRTQSVPVSIEEQWSDVRWRAPERLGPSNGERVRFFKSDIYSLGLCVIEAVTNEPPFGMKDTTEIVDLKMSKSPVERPDGVFSDAEWTLVSSMVDVEPDNRPPIQDVISAMKELDPLPPEEAVVEP